MADKKITDYSAITGANTAAGDLIEIVDISETAAVDKNKSITRDEFLNALLPVCATYVPVFSAGWGTIASTQYLWVVHNDLMVIHGQHVNGSPTAVALTIGLPIGFKIHTDIVNTIFLNDFQRIGFTAARYGVIATGGDIFLEVSRLDSAGTTNALTAMLGTAGMGTAEVQTFTISVMVEVV